MKQPSAPFFLRTSARPVALAVSICIALSLTGGVARGAGPEPNMPAVREVRTVWTSELGVDRPIGLAYSPRHRELLVADAHAEGTNILRLGFDEDAHASFRLPHLGAPGTLAFDPSRDRLAAIDGDDVVVVPGRELGGRDPRTTANPVSALGLQDPRAATFDPGTGAWYVLDDGELIDVPNPWSADGATSVPLSTLESRRLVGVAFNAADGLLYVAGADPDVLYALEETGAVVKTYDMGSLGLSDPTAIVFAPSSDKTDDPSNLRLFIADAGDPDSLGGVMEATLAPEATLAAPVVTATLVRTIDTSRWSPPSPDPSGIVYLPGRDRLAVCDSEVDETTGAGYHGVNLWQMTRTASVTDTGTTVGYPSKEPTGLGYDRGSDTLFVSDDSKRRVYVVGTGSDGRFGTSDDRIGWVDAGAYGSTDTEDPEFLPSTGHLYFLDGVGTEVYDIDPVDGVFGNGNDGMAHFDVGKFGPTDWEGLSSDPATGNLLVGARKDKMIYEVTTSGSLVRVIDASAIVGMRYLSGLAAAPASDDAARTDYWIVDRAVDNGSQANENDGKIFEISIGQTSTNRPPVVTSPGSKTNSVGDTVSYQIQASDPDGDQIVGYGASGLPTGLAVDTNSGAITGTTAAAGTFNVTLSATDSRGATGSVSFTWTVAGSGSVLTFGLDADTFVRADRPDKNFGTKPTVVVDAIPQKDGLFAFTVSGVGGDAIARATLRLFCTDASPSGGVFHPVPANSWTEGSVTWNTAPPAGSTTVATLGAVSAGTWYEVDLTSFVTGDGTYSLRIESGSKNAAAYASREGTAGTRPSVAIALAG